MTGAKRLTKSKRVRLLRDATREVDYFGVDLTKYHEPEILGLDDDDGIVLTVRWQLKASPGTYLVLSSVWWNDDTGEIMQCGTQYGNLVR